MAILTPLKSSPGNAAAGSMTARLSRRNFLLATAAALSSGSWSSGQSVSRAERNIKAVFLFNFAQFVEWPEESFETPSSPYVIGVLGQDPFGSFLDKTVKDERVRNRLIEIERYARVGEIGICHILYISRSETPNWHRVLVALQGRPILTVSDMEHFANLGGMIGFKTISSRVRLVINLGAAERERLRISSKLLNVAEEVLRPPPQEER